MAPKEEFSKHMSSVYLGKPLFLEINRLVVKKMNPFQTLNSPCE